MSRILLGVLAILGLFTFFLWNENSRLAELNQAFELRDQEQKEAIKTLQEDFKTQSEGLLEIQNSIEEVSRTIDGLDDNLQLQSVSE